MASQKCYSFPFQALGETEKHEFKKYLEGTGAVDALTKGKDRYLIAANNYLYSSGELI